MVIGLAVFGGQVVILAGLHFGVQAFKRWFMDVVIKPHIEPIQSDLRTVTANQGDLQRMVETHEKRLETFSTYTLLLLGKVFGGKPDLDVMAGIDEVEKAH